MTINALPTPPSRSDPASFASRGDAFMAALPAFVSEANELSGSLNALLNTMSTSEKASATSASLAAASASLAAASSSYKGNWSSLSGALNTPASVSHGGSLWMLLSNVASVSAAVPGNSSSWMLIQSVEDVLQRLENKLGSAAFVNIGQIQQNVWPVLVSSAYTVNRDDNGKTLVVSGVTTITLPLAADMFDSRRPFSVTVKALAGAFVTVARTGSDAIETVSGNKSMTANTALVFFPTTTTAWETI